MRRSSRRDRRAARPAAAVRAQGRRHLRGRRRLRRHRWATATACSTTTPASCRASGCSLAGQPPALLARRSARTTCSSPPTSPTSRCRRRRRGRRRQGVIHIERTRFLWEERLYERLRLRQLQPRRAAIVPLRLEFAADFRDMFEVRGPARRRARRMLRGRGRRPTRSCFRYDGLDGVGRSSRHRLLRRRRPAQRRPAPSSCSAARPTAARSSTSRSGARAGRAAQPRALPRRGRPGALAAMRAAPARGHACSTSGRLFNDWMEQVARRPGAADHRAADRPLSLRRHPLVLDRLRPRRDHHRLADAVARPGAGAGRAAFLAAHQATETSRVPRLRSPARSCTRPARARWRRWASCRSAATTAASTPRRCSSMLAGAYAERTGDMAFDRRAVAVAAGAPWAGSRATATPNGDGFVDYARGADSGLANQGWKDSQDSRLPRRRPHRRSGRSRWSRCRATSSPPTAPWPSWPRGAATPRRARAGRARAERLRAAVEERFWMEELGFYAIALDGDGELCRVRASNPGHLLFAACRRRSARGAWPTSCCRRAFESGWGMRTLAARRAALQPDVLPQRLGLAARHGAVRRRAWRATASATAWCALLTATVRGRRAASTCACRSCSAASRAQPGEPPIAYPVACLPQAWAAGSVFMMLQACLGPADRRLEPARSTSTDPRLPIGIDRLTVRHLKVGDGEVDLAFQRVGDRVVAYVEGDKPSAVKLISYG